MRRPTDRHLPARGASGDAKARDFGSDDSSARDTSSGYARCGYSFSCNSHRNRSGARDTIPIPCYTHASSDA